MGGGTWAVGAGSSQAGKDWSSAGQSGRSWLLALPQIPTTGVSLPTHCLVFTIAQLYAVRPLVSLISSEGGGLEVCFDFEEPVKSS